MDDQLNIPLLTRIAWLYYYEDKSQQEIGDMLDLPRIKVVRLLKVIREQKIVEIKLARRYVSIFEIEKEFSAVSGLEDIIVVPSGADAAANVAYGASVRFGELCKRYESIGIGSSRAVSSTLALIEPMKKKAVKRFVSLIGNTMPNYAVNPSNPFLARLILLSGTLEVDYFNLWAPAVASTKEIARSLRNDYAVASILEMANSVEAAFIGLGDVEKTVLLGRGFIREAEVADMLSRGAVGDLFTHFFGIDGSRVPSPIEERSISASIPMKCPVTAVAYGPEKVAPIVGAIRGRFISGLVTDDKTAIAVMKELRGG